MGPVIAIELLACLLLVVGGIVGILRARRAAQMELPALIKASEAGVITGAVLIAGVLFLGALGLAIAAQVARRNGRTVVSVVALADALALGIFLCAGLAFISWARAVRRGRLADLIVLLSLCSLALLLFGAAATLDLATLIFFGRSIPTIMPGIIRLLIESLICGCSVRTIICLIRAIRSAPPPPGFPV